jgi:hypothetical protein
MKKLLAIFLGLSFLVGCADVGPEEYVSGKIVKIVPKTFKASPVIVLNINGQKMCYKITHSNNYKIPAYEVGDLITVKPFFSGGDYFEIVLPPKVEKSCK